MVIFHTYQYKTLYVHVPAIQSIQLEPLDAEVSLAGYMKTWDLKLLLWDLVSLFLWLCDTSYTQPSVPLPEEAASTLMLARNAKVKPGRNKINYPHFRYLVNIFQSVQIWFSYQWESTVTICLLRAMKAVTCSGWAIAQGK